MHIPVLQKEVLEHLNPKPDEDYIDCTTGEGGHALAILEKTFPRGLVLAIDRDEKMIERLKLRVSDKRLILVADNFSNLEKIAKEHDFKADGILFDLGLSSWHLEDSKKGFSFLKNEDLDMRYGSLELTAKRVLNEYSQSEIERVLKDYGQERFYRKIAKEILKQRRISAIETTSQLVEVIKRATPSSYHHKKIHPATRTFQAIRIEVNDELGNLKRSLPQTLKVLKDGGRIVVISFHSLEDRIVKRFFKGQAKEGLLEIINKKPVRPKEEEIRVNPRSRSALLRAAKKK